MVIAANLQASSGCSEAEGHGCGEREKILARPQPAEYAAMRGHNEDTTCGFWVCRGPFVQKFANRRAYVLLFGILGCLSSASYAYFNGIISTVEKRFGIPSRVVGVITVGNDISSLIVSTVLTYYASKKHQPRWIGFGMYTFVLFCLMSALPHFIFGPGNDALSLTKEAGLDANVDPQTSDEKRLLCSDSAKECQTSSGNVVAPILLFAAQFISGLGGTLYHTLGVSYMDDNMSRSQTPLMLSFTYFIRSLGPVLGYLISSICLKLYIAPGLTPIIDNKNPRWLGAWWLGWIILAVLIFIFSTLITLFPKVLPKTELRKGNSTFASSPDENHAPQNPDELPASFADMMQTFKRLFTNRILMCNNLAAIFYVLGAMPFFIFMPKYIEIIYAQSASFASLITGTVGLAFSSFGILLSGFILSKYKPRARLLAGWNVFVGFVLVAAVISFTFLECPNLSGEKSFHSNAEKISGSVWCAKNCHCDYVKYSPVCSKDGKTNFISPCHAGCTEMESDKIYSRCSCLANSTFATDDASSMKVKSGPCPVDCATTFMLFLGVICFLQLVGSTGKTSNFLVAVRCVEDKDKPVSMGLGITLMSLAAFIPSPILFGYIIDRSCLVWGKTCTGRSNCWLYDSKKLMYTMNYTAAAFISIGVLFDTGVWYLAKNIQIFEEETDRKNRKLIREMTKVEDTSTKK